MINWFKKKTPRTWQFGDKPKVHWLSTNKSKYDMTTFCKIALTQILNINDIELIIITNDKMLNKFDSSDIEMQALLQCDFEKHQYRLTLHSKISQSMLSTIVCHELIHLKQYEKGELKAVKGGMMWKGTFYKKDTPYFDRPWEIEANKEMAFLEKDVVKLYYE